MKKFEEEYKICNICLCYVEIFDYEDHMEIHQTFNKKDNLNIVLEGTTCFPGPNVAKGLLEKIVVNKAIKNDPRYIVINQGINILSKCSNKNCQSKTKNYRVYNQFGFNRIHFPDIYDGSLKCQQCENILDINDFITIVLCDCKYQWGGREKVKQNEKFITKVYKLGEWTIVRGVKKFNENERDNNWYSLEFNVDKIPKISESIIIKTG